MRFRPNVVLEGTDELIGCNLRGPSGVRLRVVLPTPRCVVPTRARARSCRPILAC